MIVLVKLKTIAYTVFKHEVKNLLTKVPPASGATNPCFSSDELWTYFV